MTKWPLTRHHFRRNETSACAKFLSLEPQCSLARLSSDGKAARIPLPLISHRFHPTVRRAFLHLSNSARIPANCTMAQLHRFSLYHIRVSLSLSTAAFPSTSTVFLQVRLQYFQHSHKDLSSAPSLRTSTDLSIQE